MPQRSGAGLWIRGGLAVVAAGAGLVFTASGCGSASDPKAAAASPSKTYSDSSTIDELAAGLSEGDARALEQTQKRVAGKADAPHAAVTDAEINGFLNLISGIRAGFLKFPPAGRGAATVVAGTMIERFGADPTPAKFLDALKPINDVYNAALSDADPDVRFVALGQSSKFWSWIPGRTLAQEDEASVAAWKENLHKPVVRCLASNDVRTRAAAVYSLGFLPIDSAAAPAMAHLDDPAVEVRRQAILSFASRPTLLSEDLLLQRIHDNDGPISSASISALKLRGLSQEQISLGGLMTSPRADQRASVVALVKDRTDIDPVIWLLRLSHDADHSVRMQAVQALGERKNEDPAVKRRIVEMAKSDTSSDVREAAAKLMPSNEETTASLPPLPGSTLLNPKAN